MEIKNDKESTDVSKIIASIVSDAISLVGNVVRSSDFQKKAILEFARRDVVRVASEQRQKMKDDAEAEIEKINYRAAAERKDINDRATAERKMVKGKLAEIAKIDYRVAAERKMVKDKLNVELKRFDDILFGRRKSRVVKLVKTSTSSVKDNCYVVGIPFEKPKGIF